MGPVTSPLAGAQTVTRTSARTAQVDPGATARVARSPGAGSDVGPAIKGLEPRRPDGHARAPTPVPRKAARVRFPRTNSRDDPPT